MGMFVYVESSEAIEKRSRNVNFGKKKQGTCFLVHVRLLLVLQTPRERGRNACATRSASGKTLSFTRLGDIPGVYSTEPGLAYEELISSRALRAWHHPTILPYATPRSLAVWNTHSADNANKPDTKG